MTRDKVFTNWPYSVIEGAFWKSGLFNASAFIDYCNDVAPSKEIHKKVTVGATDSRTGQFVRFTEDLGYEELAYKAARASGAIPGIFEAVEFHNMTLVDGGVIDSLDVAGAVNRCRETADSDEEITLDIIMCSGHTLEEVDTSEYNSIQMFMRYKEIKKYRESNRWVDDAIKQFPKINFRYLIVPKNPLDGEILPINFSKKHNEKMIQLGLEDAKKTAEAGPYHSFTEFQNRMAPSLKTEKKGIISEDSFSNEEEPIKIST